MSLYPTLEDLQVDNMAKSQVNQERVLQAVAMSQAAGGAPVAVSLYGDLGLEDLAESYGGLDISALSISHYVPAVCLRNRIPVSNLKLCCVNSSRPANCTRTHPQSPPSHPLTTSPLPEQRSSLACAR